MKQQLLLNRARRLRILFSGLLGAVAVVAVAIPPPHVTEPRPVEEPAASPAPLPVPDSPRRVDAEPVTLLGTVAPKGALVLVIDGEAALGTLERAMASSVAPGDASLAPLRTAAERLGGALSGMDSALRHGDAGFFPALRDGCRALVELRTVARWLSAPPAVGEPIGQLTDLLRDLRFRYGAEAMRARQNTSLRPAERAELKRLATAAQHLQSQLAPGKKPAPAKTPAAPVAAPARPPAPAPVSPATGERLQVARLIQLILVSPSSLGGYLTALVRTDVVLGTLAGEQPFRGSGEAPVDSAANDLAAASDTSLLFTANLSSGDTWNYLRQDDTGSNAATALLEASPGELDPFEGDPSVPDEVADQPPASGDTATEPAAEAAVEAPAAIPAVDGTVASADGSAIPAPSAETAAVPPSAEGALAPALSGEGANPPLGSAEGVPASAPSASGESETLAESLAKELGGTFENGTLTIHGNTEATGAPTAGDDDDDPVPTLDITTQQFGNAWHANEPATESEALSSPADLLDAMRLDTVFLAWLMGAPAVCPFETPSPDCPGLIH
jgi:hypothetical protein